MNIDEIRARFLDFFRARGHTVLPSDSLVPSNDPSLLFTGAGMNQFKDDFLGRGTHGKRAATCQKCLRTGDLDRVGRTSGHHTFFEMLGNFSFGDYFKREAIAWAWEFSTREMRIDPDRIHVTVYRDDDEAFAIWRDDIRIPAPRLTRMGEADNFWPANAPSQGPDGPCGPCSELYFDFGPARGCGKPDCGPACSCGRFVEFWNLVFTQFDRRPGGVLAPLPQRNIDTGAGLERLGAVLQGAATNFDTDLFRPIVAAAADLLGVRYDPAAESASRLRRIADHVRALVFCVADNAMPGNMGRGYVVRRILRKAVHDGVKLGGREAFLHRIVPVVVAQMKAAYPALQERRATIEQVVRSEEERFLGTLERGTGVLEEKIARMRREGSPALSGEDAFLLFDSFGFPIEMTEQIAAEHGVGVDRASFDRLLKRKGEETEAATTADIFGRGAFGRVKEEKIPPTEFLGYAGTTGRGTVLRVLKLPEAARRTYEGSKKDLAAFTRLLNEGEAVTEAPAGADVAVLLDRTPFYGEGGGQVGDTGRIESDGARVDVIDCKKPDGYHFHLGRVAQGTLRAGAPAAAEVDPVRRLDIMRNHTGTHVLQAALRAVLGPHVEQAGSIVLPDRLRFDFTHPKALSRDEIRAVEDWCNRVVLGDLPVAKEEMPIDEAKKRGAIMFFGEKYGDRVRVLTVGAGVSVELCGGTHLDRTGTIGQVKIVAESSIGSGQRRIEAVTGAKAIEAARERYDLVDQIARELGCPVADVPRKFRQLVESVQELKSEIGRMRRGGGGGADGIDALAAGAREIGGAKVVAARLETSKVDEARAVMDLLTKKKYIGAAILAVAGEKPAFVIGVREDLAKARGLKAGDLAKEVGKACGGGGGGRELQAQAGASDASKIDLGFETFEKAIRKALGIG